MRPEIAEMKRVQSEMDFYLSLWRYDILECIHDITAMASRGGRDPKVIAQALHEARKKLWDASGHTPEFADMAARHAKAVEAANAAIDEADKNNPLPNFIARKLQRDGQASA